DVSIVSVTVAGTPGQGTDAASKVWFGGGPVTIAATPVFYSGRSAAQVSVGLAAAGGNAFTAGSAGIPASIPATASGATWSGTYTITQPAGTAGSVLVSVPLPSSRPSRSSTTRATPSRPCSRSPLVPRRRIASRRPPET